MDALEFYGGVFGVGVKLCFDSNYVYEFNERVCAERLRDQMRLAADAIDAVLGE